MDRTPFPSRAAILKSLLELRWTDEHELEIQIKRIKLNIRATTPLL